MNCRECQDLLQMCFDQRRLTVPAGAQEHVRECDACRGNFAAAHALFAGLAQLTAPEPPVTMSAKVAAAVLADRRVRRRIAAYRWYATVSLAACVLLLVAIGWLMPRPQETTIVQNPGPNKIEPKSEPTPLARSADDAQNAVASLTRSVTETTKSRLKVFLPETPSKIEDVLPPFPDMGESDPAIDPAAQSLKQAGMSVAQTFEPVAQTAVRAFDFFAREMPVLDFSKN